MNNETQVTPEQRTDQVQPAPFNSGEQAVPSTMSLGSAPITQSPLSSTNHRKLLIWVLIGVCIAILCAAGVYMGLVMTNKPAVKTSSPTTTVKENSQTSKGTSSADIDLQDVDKAISQSSNSQTDAANSLNDSSQQVAIPTN